MKKFNLNNFTKNLKSNVKTKIKITKALAITLLLIGGLSMADSPSVPDIVKYTPVVDGTVTGVDGTSIGNGALTTSTSGISTGRGNIASGGGLSAEELKRKLAENQSLRDDINSVTNDITNKKKEIADKSAEILKLENANREAIANVDRVAGARRRVEELNRELEGKRGEKATKVEELRELEVRYTEEIKKLNKKKEILNSLAINWTNEDLSDEGKWMPRVEEWARELKNAIDPDGTLGNKITEEETINEDEFYKDYVTNYIKSYVVVPDLKNLLKNGDLNNVDNTISDPQWDIKDNPLLKAAGIEDGTITKFDTALLTGFNYYVKKNTVKGNDRNDNDEIGNNFIKSDMDKYNLNSYYNSSANYSSISSSAYSYSYNHHSSYNPSSSNTSSNSSYSYFEYSNSTNNNNYQNIAKIIFRNSKDLEKWEKYQMENTSSIFTKKDHTLTKDNVVNFYEDYKAARAVELEKINAGLDRLEERGLLKPVEKEYKKYIWEKVYEEIVLYDTIRAFNTVLQKLDKDSLDAVRITNEKKKILELHKNKWTSDETYNKEIKLWNDVKEFTNNAYMKTLTLDEVKTYISYGNTLNLTGLKWYDENITDVQNRNDKNTKKFIKAFSDEIERLKALERDAKEVIKRYDTEIAGIESNIRKTTPDRTDEEVERDANEKLTALNDAKSKLEEKKQELAEKEKELKEKINTLRENLNIDGGTETIAHGINNIVSGDKGIALGNSNAVSGEGSVATGLNNTISGRNSFAYGAGHNITGDNSGAFGDPITIHGDGSYGFGNNITIGTQGDKQVGKDTFVLGSEVTTTVNNAIILGKGSTGVENALSIGSAGHERKIVNVADGLISDTSKEAINGSQLFAIAKGTSTDIDVDGWKNKLGINNLNVAPGIGEINLENYYTKTDVYNKGEVDNRLNDKANKNLDNISGLTDNAKTILTTALNEGNLDNPTGKFVNDAKIKEKLDLKLDKSDLVKADLIGNGITIEGTGKVLDSNLTLSITDGAISKEKLAEPLKKEIDGKVSKEVMALALVSKANVDASNVDGENISKWREKLGITDKGEIIANPNSVNYTDDTHSVVNLGKDNIPVSIKNVALPIDDLDASNKIYVDNKVKEATHGVQSLVNNSVAMAHIPQVAGNKLISFGAGAAYNGGKVASFAFGLSGQDPTSRFIYKASAGISTDKKWNIGLGFNINFGEINKKEDSQFINVVAPTIASDNEDKIKELEAKNKDLNNRLNELANIIKNINTNTNITFANAMVYTIDNFETNRFTLKEEHLVYLDSIIEKLQEKEIIVIGYTDTDGSDKYNLNLGLNRANSVKNYLESKGIIVKQIRTAGFNDGLTNNSTSLNKAMNRRVEILAK